jgi:ribose transport system ATP-binding protein
MSELELRGISKSFHGDFLLDDINLELKKGEIHVLVGENGSGKSTLMKIICGIYRRDKGEIFLEGNTVEYGSLHDAKKAGIFYQHQDVFLFDNLSIAENVYFENLPGKGRFPSFLDRQKLETQCRELFLLLDIPFDPRMSVARLGFAERQLLSALKAFVSEAKVIILDEPTATMSEKERKIFFEMLKRMRKKCRGIFYISHRMDEISTVGDRVTVLHHGRVVGTSETRAIGKEELVRLMSGNILKERYPRLDIKKEETVFSVERLEMKPILRNVSFELKKGEILGITGLMGSGRTCLASCLFGVIEPTGGKILIDRKQVKIRHPLDALKLGIALIPEDRDQNAIFHRLSLAANATIASLERFRRGLNLDEQIMGQLVQSYANQLSILPGGLDDLLFTYSGGNQQKVMIARWFMKRARIYILDEPTRGVDITARVDIYNAIIDLVSKGAAVILISSDIEEILGMCDRTLVLSGGEIVCDLPREEASKSLILDYATNEQ